MKRLFIGMVLSAAALLISGCYVDPGYSYVRRTTYQGDAYYGQAQRADGYYAAPLYDSYYGGGYGYGCCYAPGLSLGVSTTWYGRTRYRGDRYRGSPRYRNERSYQGGRWRHPSGRGNATRPRVRPNTRPNNRPNTRPHGAERRGGHRSDRDRSREH